MEFLSILTLNNYDSTLWDNLQVPSYTETIDGVTTTYTVDADLLKNEILMECSDLQLIYPDGDYMKQMIGWWSQAEGSVWLKMFKTVNLNYNPIWNVDADIVETESNSGENSGTADGDTTEAVKGYNSSTWADHTKDTMNGSSSGDWSESRSRTTRRTGNIGVTATQELIQKERDVADFNIYKYITESFKRRFCIMIY